MYKNKEGYPDPTAGAALKHIEYEEHLEKSSIKTSRHGTPKIALIIQDSHKENSSNEHYRFRDEP